MARKIGIALGSGAARGWSHIGVIEVLEEEGIRPDVVTGCSMGAFIGAAYVAGKLADVAAWARQLEWHEVVRLLDISFSGGGPVAGRLIEKLIADFGIAGNIEDLPRPFASVATDYLTGLEVWHQKGPVVEAVRASVALPGVLAPKQIGDDWFVDGGLVNPVPVSTCRALGADFIIAVNLNGELVGRRDISRRRKGMESSELLSGALSSLPAAIRGPVAETVGDFLKPKESKPAYFDVLANSINIMQDRITRSRLAGEPPHIQIVPRLGAMESFDFDEAGAAIEEGRQRTRAAMPEIRRLLGAA